MKQAEIDCYNLLTSKEDTFSNIRKGLGKLSFIKGNPKTTDEIKLHIIVDYQPGMPVIPVQIQFAYPLYFFGLTDFRGSYKKMYDLLPLPELPAGVLSLFNPYLVATSFFYAPVLMPLSRHGDLIFMYGFSIGGVIYQITFIIQCENIAYSSLLNALCDEVFYLESIRYIIPIANINQFNNPLLFVYQNTFGKLYFDDVNPLAYTNSNYFQNQIIDIPVGLPFDKNMSFGTYVNFGVTEFDLILFVKKTY